MPTVNIYTELSEYACQVSIHVQWGDMDAFQHVNNVIYLGWVESARVKYFDEYLCKNNLNNLEVGPILAWQDCKYLFPMTYPDTAEVGFRASEVKSDRILFEARIYSKKHNRLVAIANNVIMPYSIKSQSKTNIPMEWIDAIEELQG
ncbi:MAG: thioesterase family protein [Saprospiraceae bacterium]|jgi:acyl-CoA thioester hydrolase|tara:strand:+ start:417 stop:857 length:441 start_codon:yes stop_codon:yes gene_type:complete